jgi:hypothetical protein
MKLRTILFCNSVAKRALHNLCIFLLLKMSYGLVKTLEILTAYICMHVCMYVGLCTCAYVCMCLHIYIYIYIYIYTVCIHTQTHASPD